MSGLEEFPGLHHFVFFGFTVQRQLLQSQRQLIVAFLALQSQKCHFALRKNGRLPRVDARVCDRMALVPNSKEGLCKELIQHILVPDVALLGVKQGRIFVLLVSTDGRLLLFKFELAGIDQLYFVADLIVVDHLAHRRDHYLFKGFDVESLGVKVWVHQVAGVGLLDQVVVVHRIVLSIDVLAVRRVQVFLRVYLVHCRCLAAAVADFWVIVRTQLPV